MLASLTIQFIAIVLIIGFLGLIPLLIVNRRSAKIDSSFHKKNFHAAEKLKYYKTSEIDEEPDPESKLDSFKIKEK